MPSKETYIKTFLPNTYKVIKNSKLKDVIIDELLKFPLNTFKDFHDFIIENFEIEFLKQINKENNQNLN